MAKDHGTAFGGETVALESLYWHHSDIVDGKSPLDELKIKIDNVVLELKTYQGYRTRGLIMVIESMEKLNMQDFVDKKIPAEHLSFYNQLEILEDRLIHYDKPRVAKLERVWVNGEIDLIDNDVEPIGELWEKG